MDILKLYYYTLFDKELYSLKNRGGPHFLEISQFVSEDMDTHPELIKKSKFSFSSDLRKKLVDIYSQVNVLTVNWIINKDKLEELLKGHQWLKENFPSSEFSFEKIRELLSGTINIARPDELIDTSKYAFLKRGNTQYLAFDFNYGLIACFKHENGIIEDNIYIFDTEDPDRIHDMKIGCEEYLQLAYEAKLLHSWQYAYLYKDSHHNKRLLKMLPEIFPSVELELSSFK